MTTALLPGPEPTQRLLPPVTHEPRDIAAEALQGLTVVKRFGLADAYDRERVIELVAALGLAEGARWLREHRHLYFIALRQLG
jgi:hypothetical protein